ncbi:hypothetical protein BD560DRAFT_27589 [Blakeslea trispora]|nr:hypothetical protein BD560DRAFT_27589 [Blakeslea trispora]
MKLSKIALLQLKTYSTVVNYSLNKKWSFYLKYLLLDNTQNKELRETLNNSLRVLQLRDQKQAEQTKEIEQLKLKISQLQHKLETSNPSSEQERLVDTLQNTISTLENERSAQDGKLQSQKSYIKQLEAQCQALKKQSETWKARSTADAKKKKETEGYQDQIRQLKEKLGSVEQEKLQLEKELDQLKSQPKAPQADFPSFHDLNGTLSFYKTENSFLKHQMIQLHTRLSEQQLSIKPSIIDYTIEPSQRPALPSPSPPPPPPPSTASSRHKKPSLTQIRPTSSEKLLLRSSSGLVPPPPNIIRKALKPATPLGSDKAPAPSRSISPEATVSSETTTTPTNAIAIATATATVTTPPASTPPASSTPPPSTLVTKNKKSTKTPLTDSTSISDTKQSNTPKKRTMPTEDSQESLVEEKRQKTTIDQAHYDKILSLLDSKTILTSEDIKEKIAVSLVSEIDEQYGRIKSVNVISGKPEQAPYGIPDVCTIELPKKMDKHEKCYAWYIAMIHQVEPTEFNIILNHLIKKASYISTQRISSYSSSLKPRFVRLFRLITVILRMIDNQDQLRVLFYDFLRTPGFAMQMIPCLHNTVHIWRGAIEGDDIMMVSIQACFEHTAEKAPNPVAAIFQKTKELLKWTPITIKQCVETTLEYIKGDEIKEIFRTDREKFHQLKFNITKGLELCFVVLDDFKYTYEEVFNTHLWPLLKQEIVFFVVVDLMGVIGQLASFKPPTTGIKNSLQFLADSLAVVLKQPNSSAGIDLKLAACKALLKFTTPKSSHYELALNLINQLE